MKESELAKYVYQGKDIREWGRELGVSTQAIYYRVVKKGMTMEMAVKKPFTERREHPNGEVIEKIRFIAPKGYKALIRRFARMKKMSSDEVLCDAVKYLIEDKMREEILGFVPEDSHA